MRRCDSEPCPGPASACQGPCVAYLAVCCKLRIANKRAGCRQVMAFADLKELRNESEVKAKGKYRQEGKTYVVNDGDVIFFKFNLGKGK